MSKIILEMKNIIKDFSGVLALDNVSFSAYEGEILALVGENGAGKSTLMKILSGSYSYRTYSGEILVDGCLMKFATPKQSENSGIEMIYQEINMHLDLSVAENFFLGDWPRKRSLQVDWKKMYDETRHYTDLIKLDVDPHETLRNLNTSQQQMLAIARALSKHPKILVLDEPTAALTQAESKNLFEIIHKLKSQNITSILISHKLDEVFSNADRVAVMRDGQMIAMHEKGKFDSQQIVSEMVGRKISQLYPKEKVPIGETIFRVEGFTVPHPLNPQKNIVNNVSFELKKGEILGLAGLVGAGRSELVNAVFGKIKKKSGCVFLDGHEVNITKPSDAISRGIALVTEERKADGIIGLLSIKQNSTLSSLKSISKRGIISQKAEKEKAMHYFESLGIKAQSINALVQTLSGGNQQKVVLCKWLMCQPKILILDEPTRGIDVGAKYEIYKIMMGLVKSGVSIIMISSELPELISMSDRILVLTNGEIRGEFPAADCTEEKIMQIAAGSGAV